MLAHQLHTSSTSELTFNGFFLKSRFTPCGSYFVKKVTPECSKVCHFYDPDFWVVEKSSMRQSAPAYCFPIVLIAIVVVVVDTVSSQVVSAAEAASIGFLRLTIIFV